MNERAPVSGNHVAYVARNPTIMSISGHVSLPRLRHQPTPTHVIATSPDHQTSGLPTARTSRYVFPEMCEKSMNGRLRRGQDQAGDWCGCTLSMLRWKSNMNRCVPRNALTQECGSHGAARKGLSSLPMYEAVYTRKGTTTKDARREPPSSRIVPAKAPRIPRAR